jgi:hypothetical protein
MTRTRDPAGQDGVLGTRRRKAPAEQNHVG